MNYSDQKKIIYASPCAAGCLIESEEERSRFDNCTCAFEQVCLEYLMAENIIVLYSKISAPEYIRMYFVLRFQYLHLRLLKKA